MIFEAIQSQIKRANEMKIGKVDESEFQWQRTEWLKSCYQILKKNGQINIVK